MPTNAFPSLHVSLTLTISMFVYGKNRKVGIVLLIITFFIILSTMFVKQHVFLDVIGGLMLAFVIFKNKKVFDIRRINV
jgi:membrane-associated phospholipid phosphatase